MKLQITNDDLKSWAALNLKLRGSSEAVCKALLDEELAGRQRKQFIRRIHSRLNKVRADRERSELGVI